MGRKASANWWEELLVADDVDDVHGSTNKGNRKRNNNGN